MSPELTRGLLESVEYAAQQLAESERMLRDDPQRGVEAAAARLHANRLNCFARAIAVVLRRKDRADGC